MRKTQLIKSLKEIRRQQLALDKKLEKLIEKTKHS